MPVTDFRQRTAVLFIAVMLGHIILISAQVNSRAGVPLLEVVTFGAFSEVQRGAAGLTGGVRDAWSGYVNLRGVRAENEQLKRQLGELQVQFQQERARAERTRQLERLLGFQQRSAHRDDSGERDRRQRQPRVSRHHDRQGIERGRHDEHGRHRADRRRRTHRDADRACLEGAAADRSQRRRRRARGAIARAGHRHRPRRRKACCAMDFVAATADVKVGDTIVTSGIDGIYPKGFVIGKVEKVDNRQRHLQGHSRPSVG